MPKPEVICISRTDSIGDVILTLPVAAVLKHTFPSVQIIFLGREYTRPVVNTCVHVDEFLELNDFYNNGFASVAQKPDCIIHVFPVKKIAWKAKQLGIPIRIGTTGRWYHWIACNKRVQFSRRKSDLHEAQLNLKLLQFFQVNTDYSMQQLASLIGLEKTEQLKPEFAALLNKDKYKLILHPRSQGSAREWSQQHFTDLVKMLDAERFQVFISGTAADKPFLQPLLETVKEKVTDITGMMSLAQFISFIQHCDGLVANSTGPLHIAAALGKDALGIYPPMRPIHPGRWAPLGPKAKVFVLDKECSDCRKGGTCHCINALQPEAISDELHIRATAALYSQKPMIK